MIQAVTLFLTKGRAVTGLQRVAMPCQQCLDGWLGISGREDLGLVVVVGGRALGRIQARRQACHLFGC